MRSTMALALAGCSLWATLTFANVATAQTQAVVPTSYSGVTGPSTFLGPMANAPRTYQLLIHESELSSLVGLELNGLAWRLPASATGPWPAADVTFTSFDLYLSESVTPANRSLTFANNVVGIQTQVRSGPLTVPANSFTSGQSPNDFGLFIPFSSYLYTGGHLLLEMRHTGFTGTSRSVDAASTTAPGYGTLYSAAWTGSYTGTSGSQGNFAITQFSAAAIPEPGSMALLALGSVLGAFQIRSARRRLLRRNRPVSARRSPTSSS